MECENLRKKGRKCRERNRFRVEREVDRLDGTTFLFSLVYNTLEKLVINFKSLCCSTHFCLSQTRLSGSSVAAAISRDGQLPFRVEWINVTSERQEKKQNRLRDVASTSRERERQSVVGLFFLFNEFLSVTIENNQPTTKTTSHSIEMESPLFQPTLVHHH